VALFSAGNPRRTDSFTTSLQHRNCLHKKPSSHQPSILLTIHKRPAQTTTPNPPDSQLEQPGPDNQTLATSSLTLTMASSAASSPAMITLTSSDGIDITVERVVAQRSVLIKNLLDDLAPESTNEPIPIPNVNEAVLKKVMEWCEHHKADPPTASDDDSDSRKKSTDIEEWDQKYMQVDQEMLFEIILAANYLDIKALLDVGCKTVANMIKGKSPEEIRKTFNIQNDFTPEEEDQIRRENEWAEDR